MEPIAQIGYFAEQECALGGVWRKGKGLLVKLDI